MRTKPITKHVRPFCADLSASIMRKRSRQSIPNLTQGIPNLTPSTPWYSTMWQTKQNKSKNKTNDMTRWDTHTWHALYTWMDYIHYIHYIHYINCIHCIQYTWHELHTLHNNISLLHIYHTSHRNRPTDGRRDRQILISSNGAKQDGRSGIWIRGEGRGTVEVINHCEEGAPKTSSTWQIMESAARLPQYIAKAKRTPASKLAFVNCHCSVPVHYAAHAAMALDTLEIFGALRYLAIKAHHCPFGPFGPFPEALWQSRSLWRIPALFALFEAQATATKKLSRSLSLRSNLGQEPSRSSAGAQQELE
jgi:hypothetical protein